MSESFPRSSCYAPEWLEECSMGPNVLWLLESLSDLVEWTAGARVMDLGCGKAASSIFLAREFDVEVWATDLWIQPTENWKRIVDAGLTGRVHPIYADARALPYADDFFDVIISIDAFHYFGTDDFYLSRIAPKLRRNGQIAISCPGFRHELTTADVPPHLRERYIADQWHSFRTPQWWSEHWHKTGLVEVIAARETPAANTIWNDAARDPKNPDADAVRADGGRLLTFAEVVARRT